MSAADECLMNHVDHTGVACGCRSSDQTGTYAHAIAFDHPTSICASTALLSQQAPSNCGDVLLGGNTTGLPARFRLLGSL